MTTTTRPKLYLCGPMTGLPDFNYPAFHAQAALLRRAGFKVVNPAEDALPDDAPWAGHLRLAIVKLVSCHAVATLPGVEHSRGAQLEIHIAKQLGMRVCSVDAWLF
jgi:hypothetical protein